MIITGAFFAEGANISDGTLNVLGGVWDHYTPSPGQQIASLRLVLLLQMSRDDALKQTVGIEVFNAAGDAATAPIALEMLMPPDTENGFAIASVPVDVSTSGRSNFVLTASGGSVSLSLQVREAAPA